MHPISYNSVVVYIHKHCQIEKLYLNVNNKLIKIKLHTGLKISKKVKF